MVGDSSRQDVTGLLRRWKEGDGRALEELMPIVYGELRRLAAHYLQIERSGHTLQPTALVHEAYLRLVDQKNVAWQNRAHFFGIAAQMMRRILVDHARRRAAQKRDAAAYRLDLEDPGRPADREPELLAVHEALTELERLDARQARIVELRFFGGLSVEETAEAAGVSTATVKREWRTARAWLRRELDTAGPNARA
ncbi:MAG TPA: sigma-70 family RNA polymerase sigma factor [Thermoanaerobaculia bacterium]|nr:sigma-70 family RNA polymerase sigma factor [Thermoanaerobaculia bacterium]